MLDYGCWACQSMNDSQTDAIAWSDGIGIIPLGQITKINFKKVSCKKEYVLSNKQLKEWNTYQIYSGIN